MPKAARSKDPRAIAAAAAAEYVDAITRHQDITDAFENVGDSPIDVAMEEIGKLLEAKHVKEHGPITKDQDVSCEMFGREAGHLVGVVGLRLRRGAR